MTSERPSRKKPSDSYPDFKDLAPFEQPDPAQEEQEKFSFELAEYYGAIGKAFEFPRVVGGVPGNETWIMPVKVKAGQPEVAITLSETFMLTGLVTQVRANLGLESRRMLLSWDADFWQRLVAVSVLRQVIPDQKVPLAQVIRSLQSNQELTAIQSDAKNFPIVLKPSELPEVLVNINNETLAKLEKIAACWPTSIWQNILHHCRLAYYSLSDPRKDKLTDITSDPFLQRLTIDSEEYQRIFGRDHKALAHLTRTWLEGWRGKTNLNKSSWMPLLPELRVLEDKLDQPEWLQTPASIIELSQTLEHIQVILRQVETIRTLIEVNYHEENQKTLMHLDPLQLLLAAERQLNPNSKRSAPQTVHVKQSWVATFKNLFKAGQPQLDIPLHIQLMHVQAAITDYSVERGSLAKSISAVNIDLLQAETEKVWGATQKFLERFLNEVQRPLSSS